MLLLLLGLLRAPAAVAEPMAAAPPISAIASLTFILREVSLTPSIRDHDRRHAPKYHL
jgi:hypothetical protein